MKSSRTPNESALSEGGILFDFSLFEICKNPLKNVELYKFLPTSAASLFKLEHEKRCNVDNETTKYGNQTFTVEGKGPAKHSVFLLRPGSPDWALN